MHTENMHTKKMYAQKLCAQKTCAQKLCTSVHFHWPPDEHLLIFSPNWLDSPQEDPIVSPATYWHDTRKEL